MGGGRWRSNHGYPKLESLVLEGNDPNHYFKVPINSSSFFLFFFFSHMPSNKKVSDVTNSLKVVRNSIDIMWVSGGNLVNVHFVTGLLLKHYFRITLIFTMVLFLQESLKFISFQKILLLTLWFALLSLFIMIGKTFDP